MYRRAAFQTSHLDVFGLGLDRSFSKRSTIRPQSLSSSHGAVMSVSEIVSPFVKAIMSAKRFLVSQVIDKHFVRCCNAASLSLFLICFYHAVSSIVGWLCTYTSLAMNSLVLYCRRRSNEVLIKSIKHTMFKMQVKFNICWKILCPVYRKCTETALPAVFFTLS